MIEILKSAETYNVVFFFIAIALVIGIGLFLVTKSIKYGKEKELVNKYVKENSHRIEYIKYRILTCDDLKRFNIIKRWAIAAAENLQNEMINISYDYGCDYGNMIIQDINNLISKKEENLYEFIILGM
jgi:ABC-type lipoprotein release transport system permease subunit